MDDALRRELVHLADVPLLLEARIPCVRLSVEQILALDSGSVVTTGRAAGESVEVSIGGLAVAQGELVVIDDTLAVRLSDFGERKYG